MNKVLVFFLRIISIIIFIVMGAFSLLSTGIGHKYPKSNVYVFGILSILFLGIFLLTFKKKK